MAVLQMQRISIYALRKDRKPILEWIQRRGAVEINDALEEDNVFQRMDVSTQKAQIEKNIAASKQALEILNRGASVGCGGGLFGGVLGWFTRWKSSQQEKTASVQGIHGTGLFFHVAVKRRGICDRYMLFCESFETGLKESCFFSIIGMIFVYFNE